jgi:hypothetical protein
MAGREHIASGSWGSVYAARAADGTEAALKFIARGLLAPAQYEQLEEARFNEEADHAQLVRTFETFVIDEPSVAALHGAVVVPRWSEATAISRTRSARSIPCQ